MTCGYCSVLHRPCACKRPTSVYRQPAPATPPRVTACEKPNLSVRVDGQRVDIPAPSACLGRTDLICQDSAGTIRVVVGIPGYGGQPASPLGFEPVACVRVLPGMVSINNRDLETP